MGLRSAHSRAKRREDIEERNENGTGSASGASGKVSAIGFGEGTEVNTDSGGETFVTRNMARARSEAELRDVLRYSAEQVVIVEFGGSWCAKCKQIEPEVLQLAQQYPNALFVAADVDRLPEAASHIRFTPTFTFFYRGRRVDEFAGADTQQLSDHCWLHLAASNPHENGELP